MCASTLHSSESPRDSSYITICRLEQAWPIVVNSRFISITMLDIPAWTNMSLPDTALYSQACFDKETLLIFISIWHPPCYMSLVEKSKYHKYFNTLRPKKNGRHFANHIFKFIFMKVNVWNSINISLKLVPMGPIIDIPALVQIMVLRFPTHTYLTQPQWVNHSQHIEAGTIW